MRRGPEDPRPRSLLATSASRAPEQLRLAHPRSVVAGKARCRRTLDALSAPWAAAIGGLPPELASTIPDPERNARPLPQGALHRRRRQTPADVPPSPSKPATTAAANPRPTYAGSMWRASAKVGRGRPQWSGEHGADATGRSQKDRPEHGRRKPAGPPLSTGRPFRGGSGPDGGRPDKTDADACPSRSKAMASIHYCERSRRTRHVSMNPLGFVTLSPTGRRSNRSSRRFSPSPSANSSRNKIAGLRGPPLRSGPRKRGCSAGFRTGFFRVTEGNTLT